MQAVLDFLKKLIESLAPAVAVALWNYQESKVVEANNEALKAKTDLEVEKNHEEIDSKYAGKSDLDIVNDAIANGGAGGDRQSKSDAAASESAPTGDSAGNGLGQTKPT